MAVCAKDSYVASVWYDDQIGRESDSGRERKIELYLMRYGASRIGNCIWSII